MLLRKAFISIGRFPSALKRNASLYKQHKYFFFLLYFIQSPKTGERVDQDYHDSDARREAVRRCNNTR